jgi:branched-chain amino acid aminotransferase
MPDQQIPDWNQLSFAFTETDEYYHAEGDLRRTPVWEEGEFRPFGPVEVSPAAAFMSYGVGIFEGLKAQRTADGRVLLFRPADNAQRFRRSAERLVMAPFPAEEFVRAVEEMTRRNLRFVPPKGKGSLYLRPMEHAVEDKLGLGPCSKFAVTIYGCPVGEYFAKGPGKAAGPEGVRLQVLEQGRCAPGGTGAAKAMGNYAGGIAIAQEWKKKGFDDVLYLDARHVRHLTETSGSNVFVKLKQGVLLTPPLDDQILPGVTRDSVIRAAREILNVRVEERPVAIEEALSEGEEIFCTGTAWTVQSVRELVYRDKTYGFPASELRRAVLDIVRGIQTGEREDPFGWTREVRAEPAAARR